MPRVSTRVRNSATGIASHAPVTPRNRGRISRDSTINTSVRKNEIIADTLPLDNAVKKPEDVILIPLNRKLMAKACVSQGKGFRVMGEDGYQQCGGGDGSQGHEDR